MDSMVAIEVHIGVLLYMNILPIGRDTPALLALHRCAAAAPHSHIEGHFGLPVKFAVSYGSDALSAHSRDLGHTGRRMD